MQRMMQGCTYPSVLIDDLYKINRHFCGVLMVACDPYVHSAHTPEIIITISNRIVITITGIIPAFAYLLFVCFGTPPHCLDSA